jgi:hypothetical protein
MARCRRELRVALSAFHAFTAENPRWTEAWTASRCADAREIRHLMSRLVRAWDRLSLAREDVEEVLRALGAWSEEQTIELGDRTIEFGGE